MEKEIRLALVCTSVNQLGGKNNHMRNLYYYLSRSGFRVIIVCCSKVQKELKEFMLGEGVRGEDLILLPRLNKWLIFPLIFQLRNLFIRNKIDVVHTFQMQSDILAGISARLAGIKNIFACFESKIIEDNISVLKQSFYRIVNNLIKGWFKQTVVISQGLKDELIRGDFRSEDKIRVVHLGLSIPDKYKNYGADYNKIKQAGPVIGTISRLDKEKGISRFISAMSLVLKDIPEANFLIVGKGQEEEALKKQAKKLSLENKLQIKKWVKDIFPVLEGIDIFVVPSIREGFGFTILEAFLLSKPVVASRIEGIKDVIDDGVNGILTDTANPEEFSSVIVSLCKDREKAALLGQNGRKKLDNIFSIEREIKQYVDLYTNYDAHTKE